MAKTPEAEKALVALLAGLFTPDELVRWARLELGPEVAVELPTGSSLADLAFRVVLGIGHRGMATRKLFESLAERRPGRSAEIWEVAGLWGATGATLSTREDNRPGVDLAEVYTQAERTAIKRGHSRITSLHLLAAAIELAPEEGYWCGIAVNSIFDFLDRETRPGRAAELQRKVSTTRSYEAVVRRATVLSEAGEEPRVNAILRALSEISPASVSRFLIVHDYRWEDVSLAAIEVERGDLESISIGGEGYGLQCAELPAGTKIEGYIIQRRLGAGDITHVYEVERERDGTRAAMKVLMLLGVGSSTAVKRFFREVRAITSIQHPNIAEILEVGRLIDGRPFYVMELIEGMTLSKLIRTQGPLPLKRCVTIIDRVGAALMTAHKAGIVHRDVKPGNVLVGTEDDNDVKLIDFGVAKLLHDDEPGEGLTSAGQHLGTPTAMSPEQVRCEVVDERTDIYSLGVLMFYLLTGKYPFGRGTLAELKQRILKSPPPRLSDFAPVPPAFNDVVHKCLEKNSMRRFGSVEEFLDALRPWAIEQPQPAQSKCRALGIYVEAYTDDDDDDPNDDVLDDMEEAVEIAREWLASAGFAPVMETDSTALAVRLLDDECDSQCQRDAVTTAEKLYEALSNREDAQDCVDICIVLHVDEALVMGEDKQLRGGPIASTAWVPVPLVKGVSMTDAWMASNTTEN